MVIGTKLPLLWVQVDVTCRSVMQIVPACSTFTPPSYPLVKSNRSVPYPERTRPFPTRIQRRGMRHHWKIRPETLIARVEPKIVETRPLPSRPSRVKFLTLPLDPDLQSTNPCARRHTFATYRDERWHRFVDSVT